MAAVAAVAAVAVLAWAAIALTGDDDRATEVISQPDQAPAPGPTPSVTADPSDGWAFDVTLIDVDAGSAVAADEAFAWVVGEAEGKLSTIDLSTNNVISTADLPAGSRSAWYAFDTLWLGGVNGTLLRLDPDTRAVAATIEVGGTPTWLEGGEESVWLANGGGGEAVRIDPVSNTVVARIPVADNVGGLGLNADGVWIRDLSGNVHRVDPATNTVVDTLPAPSSGASLVASPDAVWVPGLDSGVLDRVDPLTDSVVAEIDINDVVGAETRLFGLHYGVGSVWVRFGACDDDACDRQGIARVNPDTNEVVAIADLPADWQRSGMSMGPTAMWTIDIDSIARIDP